MENPTKKETPWDELCYDMDDVLFDHELLSAAVAAYASIVDRLVNYLESELMGVDCRQMEVDTATSVADRDRCLANFCFRVVHAERVYLELQIDTQSYKRPTPVLEVTSYNTEGEMLSAEIFRATTQPAMSENDEHALVVNAIKVFMAEIKACHVEPTTESTTSGDDNTTAAIQTERPPQPALVEILRKRRDHGKHAGSPTADAGGTD